MSTKRILLTILAAGAVLAAVGVGPRFIGSARALPPAQAGVTIPYSGRLTNEAGNPVADGAYDFTFALYATESGGEPLWTETHEDVAIQGGAFTVLLGRVAPLPQEVLDGGARWLEVGVRGPGEAEFTLLSPRQELSAAAPVTPASVTAPSNGLSCAHTHWGEAWSGSQNGLMLYGNTDGYATLYVRDQSPNGGYGVYGLSDHGYGIGVYGRSNSLDGYGVYGIAAATSGINYGVYGRSDSTNGRGVRGIATAASGLTYGVYGESASINGIGVFGYATATSGFNYGVYGRSDSPTGAAIYGYGDIKQNLASDGLVKAGVRMLCGTYMLCEPTFFNNASSDQITGICGASAGYCTIDFGFQISERFWVAMAVGNTDIGVTCQLGSANDTLDCFRYDASSGNGSNGNIMVLIY